MSLNLDWITLSGSGETSVSKLGIGTTVPTHELDVVGDAHVSGTVSATTLTGTLSTASQPNITSVGTLSSLEVLGRITAENSVIYSKTYYVNDGGKTLQAGIDEMGTTQAAILNVSSGSYADSNILIHDKINIGIQAPIPGNMYITEIGTSGVNRTLTISGTNSTRVRMTGFQVKGLTTIVGTQGRHYFHKMNFVGGLELSGSTTNWIVFNECDFEGIVTIPNTFAGIIYFNQCSFTGNTINCSSPSPQQVILINCSGLSTLTSTTVTYVGQCFHHSNGTSILVNPGTITGTLSTAAQPNITSVGTLSSLNVGNVTSSGTVSASTFSTTGPVIANSLSVNGLDPAIDSSLNFDPSIGSVQLTHAVGGLAPTVEITSDNGNILLNPDVSGSSFPSSITVSGDIDYTGTLRQNGIAVNFGNSSGIPPISFLVRGYSAGGTGDLAYSTTVSGDQTWFGRLPAECYHQIGMTIGSDLSFVAPQSGYYFLSLAFSSMSSGTSGSRHLNSLEFTIDGNVTSIEIVDLAYAISGSTQLDQTGSWSTVMYLASGTKIRPFIHSASDSDYRYCNFGGFITNGGSSQWTTSGSDIYYSSGNVGVGSTEMRLYNGSTWETVSSRLGVYMNSGAAENPARGRGLFVVSNGNSTATDQIVFQAAAADAQPGYQGLVVNGQSLVGIGTLQPTVPLEIASSVTHDPVGGGVYYTNYQTQGVLYSEVGPSPFGLKVHYASWFGWNILVSSDSRIKTNITEISDGDALSKLRLIQPSEYNYVDRVSRGTKRVFGFIAQQVREHFPEAVSLQKEIIPNIYSLCSVNLNLQQISIPSGAVSGNLKIITPSSQMVLPAVALDGNTVQLPSDSLKMADIQDGKVFVYGYEVEDFHTLNKDFLFTINFAATQELDRRNQELEARNQELTLKVTSLESQLHSLRNALIDKGVIE